MLHPSGRLAAVLFTAALLALAAFASAGPREPAPAEAAPAHPDRLLVRFAPGTPESERMAVLERAGVRTRRYLRGAGVHVVEPRRSGQDREALLAKLRGSASVVAVEPDFELHAQALAPDDPDFAALWGLQAIRAPQAWERTTGSPSIVVGIVDTGIDYTHPDLAPNMWRNPGEMANGKDDDGNGYVDDIFGIDCITGDGDPFDDNGHGTSVAGVLGAVGNNGIGIAGVTWSVRMMALKFLPASGPGYVSDAIECLDYATAMRARGVDIRLTNNSWGGGGYSSELRAAIARADAAGLLFVVAAGNNGRDVDAIPSYPSCYDLNSVLSVGAFDGSGMLDYSNYGATRVALAAPGVNIQSAAPGGGYGTFWGTSVAAPQVSGAAVLLWALHPEASAGTVKSALLASIQPVASLQGKVASGGLLDVASAVSRPLVPDSDADGIPDAADDCPWYATQNTADRDRDGIGDACSCGDVNGDGVVDVKDLSALSDVLFHKRAAGPLCDANGDGACSVADSAWIYKRIYGQPAYCARYPRPRP